MANTTDEFKYESLLDTRSVVQHLRAVADGLDDGGLTLTTDGRELVVSPQGLLRFRLEAKRGKHRTRMVMRMSWRHESSGAARDVQLKILPQKR